MKTMEGIVVIVQESRFQLMDADGVFHLFLLGHDAGAEPEQLGQLQARQAKVRVRYSAPHNIIGYVAHRVDCVGERGGRAA